MQARGVLDGLRGNAVHRFHLHHATKRRGRYVVAVVLATVPAVTRLGLTTNEVGEGIELLHDAHEEVAAAKRLLAN